MKTGKKVRVIAHEDMRDDDYTCASFFFGAPIVGIEKLLSGTEV